MRFLYIITKSPRIFNAVFSGERDSFWHDPNSSEKASKLFWKEFDETGICKPLQIRLCFGTAFLMKHFIKKQYEKTPS